MLDRTRARLEALYTGGPQRGSDGQLHDILKDTFMPRDRAAALTELHRSRRPELSAEIGFAYGFSTLHILDAMTEDGYGHHTAIDPYERSMWHGIGLRAVEDAGLGERFDFVERLSLIGLGAMFEAGTRVDFLFIDGNHTFNFALCDASAGDAVLQLGGILVFDDYWMPSIQKVAGFIRSNLNQVYCEVPSGHVHLVAFEKVGYDQREWNHYAEF